jgi:hypothetical protein
VVVTALPFPRNHLFAGKLGGERLRIRRFPIVLFSAPFPNEG